MNLNQWVLIRNATLSAPECWILNNIDKRALCVVFFHQLMLIILLSVSLLFLFQFFCITKKRNKEEIIIIINNVVNCCVICKYYILSHEINKSPHDVNLSFNVVKNELFSIFENTKTIKWLVTNETKSLNKNFIFFGWILFFSSIFFHFLQSIDWWEWEQINKLKPMYEEWVEPFFRYIHIE